MGKITPRSIFGEFISKVVSELHDEKVAAWKDFHNRIPTLEEESTIYESITKDEVRKRLAERTGGFVPGNFSIEVSKHII